MKTRRLIVMLLMVAVAAGCVLTACDKLDDGDDTLVSAMLPGTWAFSYKLQSAEDTGLRFNYENVIFRKDSTVSITYPNGSLEGTYLASSAAIRIEGTVGNGEERQMLWRILTFSEKRITAEYQFDFNGQSVTAIVTLERTDDLE